MKLKWLVYILMLLPSVVFADEWEIDFEEVESNQFVEDQSYVDYVDLDTAYKAEYTSEKYNYKEIKEKEKEPEIQNREPSPFNFDFGTLARVVFYCFLILVAGVVIYLIIKGFRNMGFASKNKAKAVVSTSSGEKELESEENLDNQSLQAKLDKAKAEENYALAIRYYFLLYLEKLETNKLITYHQDKTNQDYLSELKTDKQVADFIKLSYPFEYTWYGKKPLTKDSFQSLESLFISSLKQ